MLWSFHQVTRFRVFSPATGSSHFFQVGTIWIVFSLRDHFILQREGCRWLWVVLWWHIVECNILGHPPAWSFSLVTPNLVCFFTFFLNYNININIKYINQNTNWLCSPPPQTGPLAIIFFFLHLYSSSLIVLFSRTALILHLELSLFLLLAHIQEICPIYHRNYSFSSLFFSIRWESFQWWSENFSSFPFALLIIIIPLCPPPSIIYFLAGC